MFKSHVFLHGFHRRWDKDKWEIGLVERLIAAGIPKDRIALNIPGTGTTVDGLMGPWDFGLYYFGSGGDEESRIRRLLTRAVIDISKHPSQTCIVLDENAVPIPISDMYRDVRDELRQLLGIATPYDLSDGERWLIRKWNSRLLKV